VAMNWQEAEDTLVELAKKAIAHFADVHKGEVFCGFAFDCNAAYGKVFLCFNTEDHLHASLREAMNPNRPSMVPEFDKMMEEKFGIKPELLYAGNAVEKAKETLTWDIGGWKYHSYNESDGFIPLLWSEWEPYEEMTSDLILEGDAEEIEEQFLNMVCRALIRLENENAFDALRRTDGFGSLVVDHDESIEDGFERIQRIRKGEQ
jgi:Domain of unknown function (DUF4303)